MNMKKTFAGAMAGALAVSAMATSASAAKLAPGNSYDIDLTKEAEFVATVKFTFDNQYIIDKAIYENGGNLALTINDTSVYFDEANTSEIKVEVEGAKGTAKQTLTYNTTWNDVNFLDWNLFNYSGSTINIPVLKSSSQASKMQAIYLDKFETLNKAYATTTATGSLIYPMVGTYNKETKTWKTSTVGERDDRLDTTVIEKITVTAKIPVKNRKFSLDELNSKNGYKDKVTATIKGLHNVDFYAIDDEDYMKATAELKEALEAQTTILMLENAVAKLEGLERELDVVTGKKALGESLTDGGVVGEGRTKAVIEAEIADTKKAIVDLTKKVPASCKKADGTILSSKEMDEKVEKLKKIVDSYKSTIGVSTLGVEITDSDVVTAETLFTAFEATRVGVRSGIVFDSGIKGYKTVSGDIGNHKPDALRQIADAIADYEGVTLTFTAKNDFAEGAYTGWGKGINYAYNKGLLGLGNTNLDGKYWEFSNADNNYWWATDNVKDSYEEWGVSMFTGAIVLNRNFSKQFSQANLVDWGTKTITFDWDELTEGRFYDASIVLHSMEILSTQNVEWVTCTVSIPEQSDDAEVVDPSQGATDDSDVIDPTPVEETTAPIITAAPETDAPAPVAPVAPVTNPTTGNAPVALAVIPVALAAAAIVAKKRG